MSGRNSRRSSILKIRRQRQSQDGETAQSSSQNSPAEAIPITKRRVSFAEKKHVKEFCDSMEQGTVWDNTYEESDSSQTRNSHNSHSDENAIENEQATFGTTDSSRKNEKSSDSPEINESKLGSEELEDFRETDGASSGTETISRVIFSLNEQIDVVSKKFINPEDGGPKSGNNIDANSSLCLNISMEMTCAIPSILAVRNTETQENPDISENDENSMDRLTPVIATSSSELPHENDRIQPDVMANGEPLNSAKIGREARGSYDGSTGLNYGVPMQSIENICELNRIRTAETTEFSGDIVKERNSTIFAGDALDFTKGTPSTAQSREFANKENCPKNAEHLVNISRAHVFSDAAMDLTKVIQCSTQHNQFIEVSSEKNGPQFVEESENESRIIVYTDDAMDLTKPIQPAVKSQLPLRSQENEMKKSEDLQNRSRTVIFVDEAMDFTKAIQRPMQNEQLSPSSDKENVPKKAIDLENAQKTSICADDSMDISSAIQGPAQSEESRRLLDKKNDENKAEDLRNTTRTVVFADDAMEFTQAIQRPTQYEQFSSKENDPKKAVDLVKAQKTFIFDDESMDFTSAIHRPAQSEELHRTSNQNNYRSEPEDLRNTSKTVVFVDDAMEFTKAIQRPTRHEQLSPFSNKENDPKKAIDLENAQKTSIFADNSMDFTSAIQGPTQSEELHRTLDQKNDENKAEDLRNTTRTVVFADDAMEFQAIHHPTQYEQSSQFSSKDNDPKKTVDLVKAQKTFIFTDDSMNFTSAIHRPAQSEELHRTSNQNNYRSEPEDLRNTSKTVVFVDDAMEFTKAIHRPTRHEQLSPFSNKENDPKKAVDLENAQKTSIFADDSMDFTSAIQGPTQSEELHRTLDQNNYKNKPEDLRNTSQTVVFDDDAMEFTKAIQRPTHLQQLPALFDKENYPIGIENVLEDEKGVPYKNNRIELSQEEELIEMARSILPPDIYKESCTAPREFANQSQSTQSFKTGDISGIEPLAVPNEFDAFDTENFGNPPLMKATSNCTKMELSEMISEFEAKNRTKDGTSMRSLFSERSNVVFDRVAGNEKMPTMDDRPERAHPDLPQSFSLPNFDKSISEEVRLPTMRTRTENIEENYAPDSERNFEYFNAKNTNTDAENEQTSITDRQDFLSSINREMYNRSREMLRDKEYSMGRSQIQDPGWDITHTLKFNNTNVADVTAGRCLEKELSENGIGMVTSCANISRSVENMPQNSPQNLSQFAPDIPEITTTHKIMENHILRQNISRPRENESPNLSHIAPDVPEITMTQSRFGLETLDPANPSIDEDIAEDLSHIASKIREGTQNMTGVEAQNLSISRNSPDLRKMSVAENFRKDSENIEKHVNEERQKKRKAHSEIYESEESELMQTTNNVSTLAEQWREVPSANVHQGEPNFPTDNGTQIMAFEDARKNDRFICSTEIIGDLRPPKISKYGDETAVPSASSAFYEPPSFFVDPEDEGIFSETPPSRIHDISNESGTVPAPDRHNLFTAIKDTIESLAKSSDTIWYITHMDERAIALDFYSHSIVLVIYLDEDPDAILTDSIKRIKILSLLEEEKTDEELRFVHDLIMENLVSANLAETYNTYEHIPEMLDHASKEVKMGMDFLFDFQRLRDYNVVEIHDNRITILVRSRNIKAAIILNITIQMKPRFELIDLDNIAVSYLLGKERVRENDIKALFANVKRDHRFLTRYIHDLKKYLDLMEEFP